MSERRDFVTDSKDRGNSPDGRSALARGYVLASRASSIGLQMAVPAGLGWWVDSYWKTTPAFIIAGVVLGFIAAMVELAQLVKESDRSHQRDRNPGSDPASKSR